MSEHHPRAPAAPEEHRAPYCVVCKMVPIRGLSPRLYSHARKKKWIEWNEIKMLICDSCRNLYG